MKEPIDRLRQSLLSQGWRKLPVTDYRMDAGLHLFLNEREYERWVHDPLEYPQKIEQAANLPVGER